MLVRLENDTFKLAGLPPAKQASMLIEGFTSASSSYSAVEDGGWSARVTPALRRDLDVFLLDERTLRLGLPSVPAYDITAPETLTLTLAGELLTSRAAPCALRPSCVRSGSASPRHAARVADRGDAELGIDAATGEPLTLQIASRTTRGCWIRSTRSCTTCCYEVQDALIESLGGNDESSAGWGAAVTPLLRAQRLATLHGCHMVAFNESIEDEVHQRSGWWWCPNTTRVNANVRLLPNESDGLERNDALFAVSTPYSFTMRDSRTAVLVRCLPSRLLDLLPRTSRSPAGARGAHGTRVPGVAVLHHPVDAWHRRDPRRLDAALGERARAAHQRLGHHAGREAHGRPVGASTARGGAARAVGPPGRPARLGGGGAAVARRRDGLAHRRQLDPGHQPATPPRVRHHLQGARLLHHRRGRRAQPAAAGERAGL